MKIKITRIDSGLRKLGFKIGEVYVVIKFINGKYPFVISPRGDEVMLYPKDFVRVEK